MPLQPHVTDHAVLRYLERVAGLDIAGLRARIARDVTKPIAAGASGITVNGISYRFCGNRVTTIWLDQAHVKDIEFPGGDKNDR